MIDSRLRSVVNKQSSWGWNATVPACVPVPIALSHLHPQAAGCRPCSGVSRVRHNRPPPHAYMPDVQSLTFFRRRGGSSTPGSHGIFRLLLRQFHGMCRERVIGLIYPWRRFHSLFSAGFKKGHQLESAKLVRRLCFFSSLILRSRSRLRRVWCCNLVACAM